MSKLQRGADGAVILLAIVALIAALKLGEEIFVPLILALVIGIVLSPISDLWERLGFPAAIGALTSLFLTLAVIVTLGMMLQPVVMKVIDAWPRIEHEMRAVTLELQRALQGLEDVSEEVGALTGRRSGGAAEGMDLPGAADALWLAPAFAGQAVIFAGVLFFFLLTRREVYDWIAGRIAPVGGKRDMAQRLILAERQVSTYFVTIALINLGFGLCVFLVMTLLGMPSPFIWGVATFLLNFLLYLGPAIMVAALGVAGLVVFDGIWALAPSLAFLALNIVESQFVTPAAIGARLSVNPLLVFLALVFFLWLWGPVGGIVAIPLLLWGMVVGNEIRVSVAKP